jgi:hypothetical protein
MDKALKLLYLDLLKNNSHVAEVINAKCRGQFVIIVGNYMRRVYEIGTYNGQ